MTEPLDWARMPTVSLTKDRRLQRNVGQWIDVQRRAGHAVAQRQDGDDTVFEAFPGDMRTLALGTLQLPDIETQIFAAARGNSPRPWRVASVREALGVPAIFRAASMIANVTGSLTMRGIRNEVEVTPQERPRIIVRPDPNRTPRDFYRDTAWNLARYGEAWWWVSSRDRGTAQSLYNVPNPAEVQVDSNPADPIHPHISWRGRSTRDGTLAFDDMRHLTFLPDDGGMRGMGPLQVCGAAVSVSVEAQEWAANLYVGGYPSYLIQYDGQLGGGDDGQSTTEQQEALAFSEAQRLKLAWLSTPPNTPHVVDDSIKDVKLFAPNPNSAQMLEARHFQNGDAARMFGVPGSLLDAATPGSSLTYQNLDDEFIKFVRVGLRIGYLETIEQAISDLLTRSTVARFNTEAFEAPNVKTRFEVYQLAVAVLGPEEGAAYARKREGLAPGDVENAPVPFLAPVSAPRIAASRELRCDGKHPKLPGSCNRLLSTTGAFVGPCPRCRKVYEAAA